MTTRMLATGPATIMIWLLTPAGPAIAQNLRLSIRGFGSRAPFGVRGIHLRVDGIPYTLPDGQAQVDAVDLDTVERIEVIRGPASVQYGNAAGGVVDISTRAGSGQPGSSIRLDAGNHGYLKGQVQGQGESGPVSASASLSWLDYQGYRDQSEVSKGLFNGRVRYQSSRGRSVTTTLNLLETPQAADPGGLTASQASANRQQATGAAIVSTSTERSPARPSGKTRRPPVSGCLFRATWSGSVVSAPPWAFAMTT